VVRDGECGVWKWLRELGLFSLKTGRPSGIKWKRKSIQKETDHPQRYTAKRQEATITRCSKRNTE